ncbi:Dynein light chain [Phytophthora megakarya]|uniref:Dynein light chain n=1 Tax=Phytophthora megakarya TaxID=4795 RepID=A0A225VX93_9STRA|nr:Dynein light chain [Phytophthora megakarya]
MFAPNATTSGSLEARQRVAQLQLQAATKHVIAVGRVVRSSYCDHSGWGYKQGSIIKSWKRRYFVLKGRELIYFAERSPSGKGIDEKGRLRISGVEFTPEFTNALVVRGELKNQAVKMQVDSNEESGEWFRKISEALQAARDEARAGDNQRGEAGAVAMKGWLLKEGQNFKTWKRRYMTLTGRTIQYRAQPNEKPLGETRVNAVNINPSRPFALDIYSDHNRILRICADSFADIEAWDHAFAKATGKRPCFGDPYAGQDAPFLGETFEESVLCEGWLYKRGQRSTEWQRRYFKLKGYKLQYQDGPGESVPKGAGTIVGLRLDSQASVDKWVNAICKLLDKDPKTLEKESPAATVGVTKVIAKNNSRSNGSGANGSRSSLTGAGGYLEGYDDTPEDNNNSGQRLRDSTGSFRSSLSTGSDSTSTTPRASTTGMIRKCGWLRKEGARVRSLKRRYFMADGNKLYYFEQIGEAPRGNGIVKSAVPNDTYPNCLDFILSTGRTLRVVAESPDEIRSWLDHFNDCIPGGDNSEERRSALERLSLGANAEDTASGVTETGTGWLLKKGKNFKNWKRRYFKLEGKQFSYSSAPNAPPLGRGLVENVTIGNARPFCLDVRFQNGRVMQVVATNEGEMLAWNRLLQAAMLTEPLECDLEQNAQFDFDDAEEDAQLDTMRTVVTAATAFKRGLSKASSTVSTTSSNGSLNQNGVKENPTNQNAEALVKKTNERAEAAAKAVAAAVAGAGRRSLRLGIAEAEEPVVCSGWLRKEGGTVKNWKRRYFTLHGPTLCYFKSDNGALLRSFTVCHVVTLRTRRLCLEITTEVGRKLLVASETQVDLDRWLDHLHRAIAAEKRKKHGTDPFTGTKESPVSATPLALPVEASESGSLAYKVL